MAYEPKKFSPAELAELHALPDDSLLTAQEAAAFLRLKYGTLAWYRCQGGGPAFTRVGPKLIRYRLGDLRDYGSSPHGCCGPHSEIRLPAYLRPSRVWL